MIFMLLTGTGVLGNVDWGNLLLRFGMCVILGTVLSVIAAVPPALRAARMQAADAMRTEI
jgi:ABC-type lipoprotein release transport system permease subunit